MTFDVYPQFNQKSKLVLCVFSTKARDFFFEPKLAIFLSFLGFSLIKHKKNTSANSLSYLFFRNCAFHFKVKLSLHKKQIQAFYF